MKIGMNLLDVADELKINGCLSQTQNGENVHVGI